MNCLCGHGEMCEKCTTLPIDFFLKTLASWKSELADGKLEISEKFLLLEKQLAEANEEINWWKKKHKEDCQEMRLVGRREGEKDMREKCQKACIDVARSESYYSDNVGDECAEAISKIEISRSLEK